MSLTPRQHQEVAKLARRICDLVLADGYQANDSNPVCGDEVLLIQGSKEFHRLCKLLGVEFDDTPAVKPRMYYDE